MPLCYSYLWRILSLCYTDKPAVDWLSGAESCCLNRVICWLWINIWDTNLIWSHTPSWAYGLQEHNKQELPTRYTRSGGNWWQCDSISLSGTDGVHLWCSQNLCSWNGRASYWFCEEPRIPWLGGQWTGKISSWLSTISFHACRCLYWSCILPSVAWKGESWDWRSFQQSSRLAFGGASLSWIFWGFGKSSFSSRICNKQIRQYNFGRVCCCKL